jgi:NAD(P)-dependent dehydrogenase (short-subunit alcohol dehydrogenase family)
MNDKERRKGRHYMNLTNKRVIVTGGASGIAASAVMALVGAGAQVTSIDLAAEAGLHVAEKATAAGPGRARFAQASVADRGAMQSAVDEAVADMGGLDALIHAAGIQQYKPAEDLTDEDWDRVMNVNARGTMIANQAVFLQSQAEWRRQDHQFRLRRGNGWGARLRPLFRFERRGPRLDEGDRAGLGKIWDQRQRGGARHLDRHVSTNARRHDARSAQST